MLSFGNATGNLFNRLGKLGLVIKQMRSNQNSQLTNMTDTTNGVVAQYNGEPDIQALMGSSYIGLLGSEGSFGSVMQAIAQATVNRMVFRDNPQLGQDLLSTNVPTSLKEIIRQMKLAGASVLAATITGTPGSFTGIGNGVINVSVKRPLDGLVLENTLAENVLFTCISDSYNGGAIAGNEGFSVTGTGNQSDVFGFNWPLGSNAIGAYSAIDGNSNVTSGNLLTNSGFETFTVSNTPDNFTIDVGAAGTNVFSENSINYDGTHSLRITGDAAGTLTRLRQQFSNSSTGTGGALASSTQYSFNIFVRRDAVAPGAGILTIDLVDGNGVVINDNNNVANSFTIDLTTLTTVYSSFKSIFRTPTILPTNQYLRLRLTTALTNARSVYLDKMSMGVMGQLYTSGPYFAIHSGSVPFAVGDYATVVMANSRGAGGTLDTFQTLFSRLFPDMINSEFLLPSSSTPTISDNLIG